VATDDETGTPRAQVAISLGYLANQRTRMNYPEYRKQGLPVTSSMVESLIKEINYRVKGTEKFWDNPEGAEAILQLRAAVLSDDDRLAPDYAKSEAGRSVPRLSAKRLVRRSAGAPTPEEQQALVPGVGARVDRLRQHRRRAGDQEGDELRERDPEVGEERGDDCAPGALS